MSVAGMHGNIQQGCQLWLGLLKMTGSSSVASAPFARQWQRWIHLFLPLDPAQGIVHLALHPALHCTLHYIAAAFQAQGFALFTNGAAARAACDQIAGLWYAYAHPPGLLQTPIVTHRI